MAVTSLVLGVLSLLTCGLGVIFSIPGLITGVIGLRRAKGLPGPHARQGMAITGVVLSAISLVMLPVVGLMAAIAVPNFVKAREAAQRAACVANLRQIDAAKQQWAVQNRKAAGDPVEASDLIGAGRSLSRMPVCPGEGTYQINPAGSEPECTVHGSLAR